MSRKFELAVTITAIIMPLLLVALFADGKLIYIAGAILFVAFIIYTAFSVEKTFMLLAIYICSFAIYGYLVYFPGFSFMYTVKISYPLFILLVMYWVIYLLKDRETFKFKQMDVAVMIFLAAMFLATINGLSRGYSRGVLIGDIVSLPFALSYFIFLYSPLKKRVNVFYNLLLACTIFVSIHFIYAVATFKTLFFLQRVVSRHIHLAQFAIPYIIATLIYSKSRRRRFLFAFLIPLVLLGVVFSQQRALYGSIALTIITLAGIFIYAKRKWIRDNLKTFAVYLITIIALVVIILAISQTAAKGKFLVTFYSRILLFLNPSLLSRDMSWAIRVGEISSALKGLEHFWLFGKGFGAAQVSRFRYVTQTTIDNSYAYLIWKTGIIGLLSLLYVYFTFFKRALLTLRKRISEDERILLITALLNAAGMMIIAFTNSSIAYYRLIFIWAALFACTEIIARKYDRT